MNFCTKFSIASFVLVTRLCFCWLVLSPLIAPAVAQDRSAATKPTSPVRLLSVGNSFTANATRFLDDLAAAGGQQLIHRSVRVGGSPLQLHAEKALAFERDPLAPTAVYSTGKSLQQELMDVDWDYVSLQQASIKSHDIETYRPYAQQLKEIIGRYAPQARLLIHQTWAYRVDDPRFSDPPQNEREPQTQAAMHAGLSAAYQTIAAELGARQIPVGDAFHLADNDDQFGYRPDQAFKHDSAKHPQLPNQDHSLHVGWRWQKADSQGDWDLKMDGHHASPAGEYLAACVWYEVLFQDSCLDNPFVPDGIDPQYASFLRQVAHQAVAAKAGDQPAPPPASIVFDDPQPQQYRLSARASALDPSAREYPEINFVFGTDDKPQDVQHASVDTRVPPQGKLVIWLMGHNEGLFDRLNSYGLHAVQVSYANKWFSTLCQPAPATRFARGDVRLEAATGLDMSSELNLLPADGAMHRALHMVKHLAQENPQGNWQYFLSPDGRNLRWEHVILSGSSHGSTTAARWAKYQRVDRVVMLCGPRDQDQDWQSQLSATPGNRYFGFSHVLDGGWTGDHYCRSWELLGMHQYGPIVNVDSATAPFGNTRRLISAADVNQDAGRAHSAVTPGRSSPRNAQDQLLYEPVWKYLYTHPVELTGSATELDPSCAVKEQ